MKNSLQETIRCFFAIPLPEELINRINRYTGDLRKINPEVKWVKAQSLHITLKFLGNIEPGLVDSASIATIDIPKNIPSFNLRAGDTGAFPNRTRPRVFWLNIDSIPDQPLFNLQENIERALEPLGIEREGRRFSPHLTLGRVRTPADYNQLWKFIDASPFEPMEFDVKEFLLMRSYLKPTGAEYRIIQKYPLRLG